MSMNGANYIEINCHKFILKFEILIVKQIKEKLLDFLFILETFFFSEKEKNKYVVTLYKIPKNFLDAFIL